MILTSFTQEVSEMESDLRFDKAILFVPKAFLPVNRYIHSWHRQLGAPPLLLWPPPATGLPAVPAVVRGLYGEVAQRFRILYPEL